jgi:hypothetical protein
VRGLKRLNIVAAGRSIAVQAIYVMRCSPAGTPGAVRSNF